MKNKLKHFYLDHNPLVQRRRKELRSKLKNNTPTFLCPNCIGGHLFHDLGIQFRSPTVNLMMLQTDFLQFVLHLDAYLDGEFEFFEHPEYQCPCAYLHAEGIQDIVIHFSHYASKEDALEKWYERCKRIDRDNLFVFIEERDGITKEQLLELKNVKARGILAYTAFDYPDIPYALQLKHCEKYGKVVNVLDEYLLDGSWDYEKYFDFVKWFNEANGGNYDVSPYLSIKKA